MRHIAVMLLTILPLVSSAQKEELVYFSGRDASLVGVKSSTGRVVIPPKYGHLFSYEDEKITGNEILLLDPAEKTHDSMKYDYRMKVFDRKGSFMYCPYWVDNGPDYYVEGLRRFVEKGKMGAVDRKGKKLVAAKYNYLNPFYRGYALACLDCRFTRFNNDEEHCCGYAGSKYAVIDRSGKIVANIKGGSDIELTDSMLAALKLTNAYSPKEKSLIKSLEKVPEVQHFMRHNSDKFCLVIAEKPKNPNGLYLISFRMLKGASGDDLSFLVSGNGKTIFYLDRLGNEETLNEWRKGK